MLNAWHWKVLYSTDKLWKMLRLEKAVLQTVIYSDLFDYPLKGWEIQKWLIKETATLNEVEQVLGRLVKRQKLMSVRGFYFLPGREMLVRKRVGRMKVSQEYWQRAERVLKVLQFVPWIKMVGVSGGLAVDNVDKSDDIDVMIVTSRHRMWLCRVIILGYLEVLGLRRKRGDSRRLSAGKLCINILLEESNLAQTDNNIYVAHEVLQMRLVWQKGKTYQHYLSQNLWVFDWLPNWVGNKSPDINRLSSDGRRSWLSRTINQLDDWAKRWQLSVMKEPSGDERISDSALYFHPVNYQTEVLKKFRTALKRRQLAG